ncbi:hypothetical protein O6P43_005977 [Quillaja saponaria]|uniref:Uncharacterized protein n=1 Tax=Quillaja saponaria TaxID=32244 RepID=A0AAD7Q788_QUISA|nr:hypothetical protein O6P43_005977 [Quillaja saponaria]
MSRRCRPDPEGSLSLQAPLDPAYSKDQVDLSQAEQKSSNQDQAIQTCQLRPVCTFDLGTKSKANTSDPGIIFWACHPIFRFDSTPTLLLK